MLVTVVDGRGMRLRGDPRHAVTRGFLCGKVARYLEREYHPDRLLYPRRRVGEKGEGRFEPISWDEALEEIAGRLGSVATECGPEAVLPYSYAGTMGLLNGAGMDRRFFHRLGASRLDRTICSAAGTAALERTLGHRYGTDPEQFSKARLILAWGANILGTNVHLWPFIVEARRAGGRFYTIDPVRNRTGRAADRHYPVNPGSDLALALGLMHVIIGEGLHDEEYVTRHTSGFADLAKLVKGYPPGRVEEFTGIPADDIVTLAREYATIRPAVIRLNYGVQRSQCGSAATRAISLLPALTGAWREPGGGLLLTTSGAFALNQQALARPDLQWSSGLGRESRLVNMSELGKALTTLDNPPVKALVVYNSNPAAIAPNQNLVLEGLRRQDLFTVVLEQFQTDTADYADLVLPATTFLEHTDLYLAYGHYYLQLARPALPAPGETRSNVNVFQTLAARMGFQENCFQDTLDDMIRQALDSGHPHLEGITLERLDRERFVRLNLPGNDRPFLPFAAGGFGTPDGKCEFDAASLEYHPPAESRFGDRRMVRRFPLEFLTPKVEDGINSTFGHRDAVDRECGVVDIHSSDASVRGIVDGSLVRVFNDRGWCRLTARVGDETVSPGVLSARAVRWLKRAGGDGAANALTADCLTDDGGGATFYSCLVEIEKC